jgi:hypothetical protein
MQTRSPMRQVTALSTLIAILLVSGCSAPPGGAASSGGAASQAVDPVDGSPQDSGGGLPTKGEAGVGTKDDSGLGTKDDSGLGTKDDSGLPAADAGGTMDAGSAGGDASSSPSADAGGEVDECFACAARRGCAVQVNECIHSSACMAEGKCDLACLTSSPFGGVNPHCIESCSNGWDATEDLLAAVTCGFHVCPAECLRPLISCGGDAGTDRMEPMEPGCIRPLGAVPY